MERLFSVVEHTRFCGLKAHPDHPSRQLEGIRFHTWCGSRQLDKASYLLLYWPVILTLTRSRILHCFSFPICCHNTSFSNIRNPFQKQVPLKSKCGYWSDPSVTKVSEQHTHHPALSHVKKDWRLPEVFGLCCSLKDMTVPTNMHSLLVEHSWITKAGPSFFSPQSLMVARNVFTQVHKGELGLLCFSNRLEFSKKSWHGSFFWNKLWSHAEILSACQDLKTPTCTSPSWELSQAAATSSFVCWLCVNRNRTYARR